MKRYLIISILTLAAICSCTGKSYTSRKVRIESSGYNMKMQVLQPKDPSGQAREKLCVEFERLMK